MDVMMNMIVVKSILVLLMLARPEARPPKAARPAEQEIRSFCLHFDLSLDPYSTYSISLDPVERIFGKFYFKPQFSNQFVGIFLSPLLVSKSM